MKSKIARFYVLRDQDPQTLARVSKYLVFDPCEQSAYGVIGHACVMFDHVTQAQIETLYRPFPADATRQVCGRLYAIADMLINGGLAYVRAQITSAADDSQPPTTQAS